MSAIDNYTSEIRLLAGNRLPQYWLYCEGQSLPVADNEPLFEQIGYRYGGSGATFALPNIPARGPNLRYIICTLGIKPPDPDFSLGTALMGEIRYIVGLPQGCRDALPAEGQTLAINFFIALYSLFGTRFGGNGTNNFQLPNLPVLTAGNGPSITPLVCVFGIFAQPDKFYSDAYVSEVRQMALNFTARGWLPCQGQTLQVNAQTILYSLLGSNFGPSDNQNFNLPTIADSGEVAFFINAQGVYPDTD